MDIKQQWEGEVYISPGTIFRDGILVLAKSTAPKIDILKSDPKGKYIIFRISNTNDIVINIYAPSGIIKEKKRVKADLFPQYEQTNRHIHKPKRQHYTDRGF